MTLLLLRQKGGCLMYLSTGDLVFIYVFISFLRRRRPRGYWAGRVLLGQIYGIGGQIYG